MFRENCGKLNVPRFNFFLVNFHDQIQNFCRVLNMYKKGLPKAILQKIDTYR